MTGVVTPPNANQAPLLLRVLHIYSGIDFGHNEWWGRLVLRADEVSTLFSPQPRVNPNYPSICWSIPGSNGGAIPQHSGVFVETSAGGVRSRQLNNLHGEGRSLETLFGEVGRAKTYPRTHQFGPHTSISIPSRSASVIVPVVCRS